MADKTLGRKIIFEGITGSKLYGTDLPTSDDDFTGVFLPSVDDLLGLQHCAGEWSFSEKLSQGPRNTAGDTDRKFFSLQRFFTLVGKGQPTQLEIFFCPPGKTIQTSPEWEIIQANKDIFISQDGIQPFLGFARAQAHKAVIKGNNLNLINKLLTGFEHTKLDSDAKLYDYLEPKPGEPLGYWLFGQEIPSSVNEFGYTLVEIAGRSYDPAIRAKMFVKSLKELLSRYGSRTADAADNGYDYKSLLHCIRLLYQAEEFLLTGHLTFPRPPAEIDHLMSIRHKQWPEGDFDLQQYILDWEDRIKKDIIPKSPLPKKPNWVKINRLCTELLRRAIIC